MCVCVCEWGPERREAPWGGALKGGASRVAPRTQKIGAPKGGGPKISRFFFFLSTFFFLSSLSWGSSRGILVVFVAPGPSNVHVLEFSVCLSCETPAASGRGKKEEKHFGRSGRGGPGGVQRRRGKGGVAGGEGAGVYAPEASVPCEWDFRVRVMTAVTASERTLLWPRSGGGSLRCTFQLFQSD